MEVISRILKLKKQTIEKSLVDVVKKRDAIDVEISVLEKDRDNRLGKVNEIFQSINLLSGIDLRAAQKWQDHSTRSIVELKNKRLALELQCENLTTALRDLTGKVELNEKQIKTAKEKAQDKQLAFEGEPRLILSRLSNLTKDR